MFVCSEINGALNGGNMAVTIMDIARATGVSRGTVDRALNNRGRVNPEVAERIRETAERLGYTPNIGARALALSNRHFSIGVVLQFADTPLVLDILDGVQAAAKEVAELGCEVTVKTTPGTDTEWAVRTIDKMKKKGVNAIALFVNDDEIIREKIRELKEAGIDIVTLNADVADSERLCFVGTDSLKAGRTGALLMTDMLGKKGKISILIGTPDNANQRIRQEGFLKEIRRNGGNIEIIDEFCFYNNSDALTNHVEELLLTQPELSGIYLNGEGKNELALLLKEYRREKKVRLVAYDMAELKKEYLMDRTIDYIIDEDGYQQGYLPVMTLFHLLYRHENPESDRINTDIRIMTAANV